MRDNGISFAWCKATEGVDYVDPTFAGKVQSTIEVAAMPSVLNRRYGLPCTWSPVREYRAG